MIDKERGAIVYSDRTVSSQLTRSAYLASPFAEGATTRLDNAPFASFRLEPRTMDGRVFGTVLDFKGEELTGLSLWQIVEGHSTSWDEWSEAEMLADRARHDAWLEETLGLPPYISTRGER